MSKKRIEARLDDVFISIRNGITIKQDNLESVGLPITRIETIATGEVNRDKMGYAGIVDSTKYKESILDTGDILMSHINSAKHLGKTAIYEKLDNEEIIHGMNLLRLKVDQKKINSNYANYYFNSLVFKSQILNITKNSVNQSSFTVTGLKNLTIPLLPMEAQVCIAKILDKINQIIALHKEQLKKLDELIKSLFLGESSLIENSFIILNKIGVMR